ncbi:MAG: hypothetical protein U0T84_03635 [Chitinophagales bacterium]
MIDKLNTLLTDTAESMKKRRDQMKDAITEKLSVLGSVREEASEKLLEYSNQVIHLTPVIQECGYRAKGIEVSLGLPPDIVFTFEKFADVSDADREAILAKHSDNEWLGIMVKALVTADRFHSKLSAGAFTMTALKLTIGLPPSVTVELSPNPVPSN